MNVRTYPVGVLAAAMVLGCSTMQVKSDRDRGVQLRHYRTFKITQGQVLNDGVVDSRDTLVHDRVQSALEHELRQKGLEETAQNPELIVTYTAAGRHVLEVHDGWYDDDLSMWASWYRDGYMGSAYGGPWVEEDIEGTLVLDLLDAKTNQLVWRSTIEIDDDDLRSAKVITKAVDKGLEQYPGAPGME